MGRQWTRRTTTTSPPARAGAAIGYDPVRQVVVLFGGDSPSYLGDTWTFSGGTWTSVAGAGPSPRSYASMTWDPIRNELVMFGGYAGGTADFAETWVFANGAWAQRLPSTSPSARRGAGLVWDSSRQRVIAFGGSFGSSETFLSDTWAWDGTNWSSVTSVGVMGPRWVYQAAYDTSRNVTFFYGGFNSGSQMGGWELGTSWMQRSWASQPAARHAASIVYDSSLQRFMVVGGSPASDAFLFDGTTWTSVSPAPSSRAWSSMVYDSNRNRIILFGGFSISYFSDTWEY